ncbi:MAG: alpha-galactosidase [Eubacteriales bacterium]|nr:alpha-galactosidase [Eubacteriales bacterium]
MGIIYHQNTQELHLFNSELSYIIKIQKNGGLMNLYYGKRIHDKEDFGYLQPQASRPLTVYESPGNSGYSLQYIRREYPDYGRGDFRTPAYLIRQENGSRITAFSYDSHKIYRGKKKLEGLPATYAENDEDADTLEIRLTDAVTNAVIVLSYTIFNKLPVIARHVQLINGGTQNLVLERALSASIDLPDSDYEMVYLTGAWARERHVRTRKLDHGISSIGSIRGASSAEYNPFFALKRPAATEDTGEVYGFCFIYSGNHLEQAEVDTDQNCRVSIGIHPDTFEWALTPGETFVTPEAVFVYTDYGLNAMSQTFHCLFKEHLMQSTWKDRQRPVLINNWEATEMDFTENKILDIATAAKDLGIELFVLDDGWFGGREDDTKGLGDWFVTNFDKLPEGIEGLSAKITDLGLQFGLWFEPEMVNPGTKLYDEHPDWILCPAERTPSPGRNQYVLDFTRDEVVDYIYDLMEKVLSGAHISYVKWDMNRYITECYSTGTPALSQGKTFHKYILGVYRLYEKLTLRFPDILFESCASGGARFDPGILYYAPQAWTSDDTDAVERIKIQYGTSLVYPVSSMGAHVSQVPNQQTGRCTPLKTRGDVAMFGAFGYELDITALDKEEKTAVKEQITFVKKHRLLLQHGTFYRLKSPFRENAAAWMMVSPDRTEAIAAYYNLLGTPNCRFDRLFLRGLDPDRKYHMNGSTEVYYGDELMYAGIPIPHTGVCESNVDFSSFVFYLSAL